MRPRVLFIEFYTLTAKNNHVQNTCTLKNITNNKNTLQSLQTKTGDWVTLGSLFE